MKALIRILHNVSSNTFHPIYYTESWFPGGPDADINQKVTRFKSKGHHTTGFPSLADAADSVNTDLVFRIKKHVADDVILEIDQPDEWDGSGIPTDIVLR